MAVEIYGHLTARDESEAHLGVGSSFDPDYVERQARAHEAAGFDGVLVGGGGDGPDSFQIAALAAARTLSLRYLIAHRPGFVHPTSAARSLASLDHASRGRVLVHVITGRPGDGTKRRGDQIDEGDRYGRTREFIQVLKQTWLGRAPFDYDGKYYQLNGFISTIFPFQVPRIPVSFAGNSDSAFAVGAGEADAYAFYAQPLEWLKRDIARVRQAAQDAGRSDAPSITVLVRVIVADTDEQAWERAEALRDLIATQASTTPASAGTIVSARDGRNNSAGDQRQVDVGAISERHDRALWAGLVNVTSRGKSTALVGSTETIVAALLDYVDAGVSRFILDGFFREDEVPEFGRTIVPALRAALAEREDARVTEQV